MIGNLLAFAVAALLEIAGCFALWAWLRRGASPLVIALGVASLVGFAVVLTRVDAAFAGRAYAAYGGTYIPHRWRGYGWWNVNGPRFQILSARQSQLRERW